MPALTVEIPADRLSERRYILRTVFEEFLGIQVDVVIGKSRGVVTISGEGRTLQLADSFFGMADRQWLKPESMPLTPLAWCELPEAVAPDHDPSRRLPVLYGAPLLNGQWFSSSERQADSGIDLLGSVFFLLTRYEEAACPRYDRQSRFPADASLAFQEGFLMRPLADEYVELLWKLLQSLWPGLKRKEQRYRVFLSHDVDQPFAIAGRRWSDWGRSLGGDMLRRRSPSQAVRRIASIYRVGRGDLTADPGNTFSYIMSESERRCRQSAFYFICNRRNRAIDGSHEFETPLLERVVREVATRGHEIGLHPGYDTYDNPELIAADFATLRRQCEKLGVNQSAWGGRQHYLRWTNPVTWRAWDQCGLDYDSTLSFADHIGFRCGTCREYPAYDLSEGKPLRLVERPLLVMDQSLLSYMKLSRSEACQRTVSIIEACRRVQGNFTLLWHNNLLAQAEDRHLYESILDAAA